MSKVVHFLEDNDRTTCGLRYKEQGGAWHVTQRMDRVTCKNCKRADRCFVCKHSGQSGNDHPCNACQNYSMFEETNESN